MMTMKLERLLFNARQCRALAETAITLAARKVLIGMAADYEERAAALQANEDWLFAAGQPAAREAGKSASLPA
jgi:hypothetical protein